MYTNHHTQIFTPHHQWVDVYTPSCQDFYTISGQTWILHQAKIFIPSVCRCTHATRLSFNMDSGVQVQVLMFANKNHLPTDPFSQSRNAIFNFHNSISVLLFGCYVYVCDSRCLCVPHMCWHHRCIQLPVIKVTDASYPLELMVKEVVNHLMHLLTTESRISPREIS